MLTPEEVRRGGRDRRELHRLAELRPAGDRAHEGSSASAPTRAFSPPTECFAALAAGADALKIFPAVVMGREGLKAIRAVLPPGTRVFAVGGVGPADFAGWRAAGADGFGLGSSLFQPGWPVARVAEQARACAAAWDATGGAPMA